LSRLAGVGRLEATLLLPETVKLALEKRGLIALGQGTFGT
jgi:hypothetical protein